MFFKILSPPDMAQRVVFFFNIRYQVLVGCWRISKSWPKFSFKILTRSQPHSFDQIILFWFWHRCASRRYGASEATDEEAGDNRRSSEHSLNASKSIGRCHEAVEAIEGPDDEADGALDGGRTCSKRQVVITRRYLLQNKSAKLCLHLLQSHCRFSISPVAPGEPAEGLASADKSGSREIHINFFCRSCLLRRKHFVVWWSLDLWNETLAL